MIRNNIILALRIILFSFFLIAYSSTRVHSQNLPINNIVISTGNHSYYSPGTITSPDTVTQPVLITGNAHVDYKAAQYVHLECGFSTALSTGCGVFHAYTGTQPSGCPTPIITGSNTICNGGSVVLSAATSTSGGGVITSYKWQRNGSDLPGATFITYNAAQAGMYTIIIKNSLNCTVISAPFTVNTNPAIIVSQVITNVTCVGGNNGSISVTASGGTAPYSYLWNNGSTNVNRTVLTTGTYTVTVTDAKGCTKTSSSTIVALNSIPAQPAAITGPIAVCKNTNVIYSIPAVPGATSYIWTATSGASIILGQGSPTVTVSFSNIATNASLSVVANNVCSSGVARTLAYMVSSVIPAVPATINGSLYGLCNLASVAYNCPAVPNATSYLWTVPTDVTILTGQGTNSITVKYAGTFTNTGSLSVVAQSGCGSSAACTRTVNVKPQQPVISGLNWACKNQPGLVYSVAAVTGASSYTWTIVAGSTLVSGQGTTSIVVNWGGTNGVIKCTANNACGSSLQASLPVSFTCKEEGDLFDFSEISLFPNPTTTSVTLQFDGFTEGKAQLMVFDLVGQEVLSKTLNVATGENSYQLDVASFPKGIYSMRVIYNGMTRNEKMIVQ